MKKKKKGKFLLEQLQSLWQDFWTNLVCLQLSLQLYAISDSVDQNRLRRVQLVSYTFTSSTVEKLNTLSRPHNCTQPYHRIWIPLVRQFRLNSGKYNWWKTYKLQVQVKYRRCITKDFETTGLLSVDVKVVHLIFVVENVVLLLSYTWAMILHRWRALCLYYTNILQFNNY